MKVYIHWDVTDNAMDEEAYSSPEEFYSQYGAKYISPRGKIDHDEVEFIREEDYVFFLLKWTK